MVDHYYYSQRRGNVFVKGDRLRFLTLTVPDNDVPLVEVSSRFRAFANSRFWRDLTHDRSYICVYEPHPNGHGWHIHILANFFIPADRLSVVCQSYLFGHTHVESADSGCAFYIAKYISKSLLIRRCSSLSRRVRIVNVSRDLLPVSDIICKSASSDFIRSYWDCSSLPSYRRFLYLYYLWVYSWSGTMLLPSCLLDEQSFYNFCHGAS